MLDLFRDGAPVSTSSLSDDDIYALSVITAGRSGPRATSRADDLQRIGATAVRQITERSGRAYYVFEKVDGSHCYGVGNVGSADRLGQITCPRSPVFPSPSRPILSLAVFRATPETGTPSGEGTLPLRGQPCCLSRLEGFAADGVSSVGVVTGEGRTVAVTPVIDNVYIRTDDLPTEPIRALVALDANGDRLFTECFAQDGCGW
jgi:hypothetical protein